MNEELLDRVSKKTNVKKDLIIDLAKKLSSGNMKDEKTIKEVITSLEDATGKKITNETKEKIVDTIKNDKVPKDVDKMF